MEISFKLIGSFMSYETKISCLPGSHVKMEPGKGGGLCWRGGGAREIRSPRRGSDISLSLISVVLPLRVSSI